MTTNTRLQGSLKDFGLVEVLQMMEFGSMTGAIYLRQNERVGIVYFKDGKLANCSELDPSALTLGDVLQQLGMATRQDIDTAFAVQVQDPFSKRIGERLIDMGVITDEQLREALRAKALWIARELATWKEGTYDFVDSPVGQARSTLPYGEEALNMEVMGVTMEMVRYIDEWDQLRVYLPQGMQTILQMAPTLHRQTHFDMRLVELLAGITSSGNRPRSVRRLASTIRRPELDVARDLTRLIHDGHVLTIVLPQYQLPQLSGRGSGVRLPDPAERLRMEGFELLDVVARIEQEWNRRRTPEQQLPALVEFTNWTMNALADTCRANGTELNPATLENLLTRHNLRYMGTYRFRIDNNNIDVDDFSLLCRGILQDDIIKANDFFEEASIVLQKILLCIFDTINGRVASLYERLENQEVWEAMFTQFNLPRA